MKYPKKLKYNDTMGIVAVSDGANLDKIDKSISNFNKLGFNVIETESVRSSNFLVSSDGRTRAKEFMELWQNREVKYILSARGGEFLMEMLPYLDEYSNSIKISDPKWVQGYSDSSLLLFYLTTKFDIATIHAENLSEFAMNLDSYHKCLKNTIDFLKSENDEFVEESFDKYQLMEFEEGNFKGYNLTEDSKCILFGSNDKNISVKGRIIGGCIDAISILLGTKYDHTNEFCKRYGEGIIWYIDNCELNSAEFYRRLWQMREAGWFENVNAFLIGRSFASSKSVGDFTFLDAINKALYNINVPIIFDVDIGHVPPQLTIINGSYAKVEYNDGKLRLIQKLN